MNHGGGASTSSTAQTDGGSESSQTQTPMTPKDDGALLLIGHIKRSEGTQARNVRFSKSTASPEDDETISLLDEILVGYIKNEDGLSFCDAVDSGDIAPETVGRDSSKAVRLRQDVDVFGKMSSSFLTLNFRKLFPRVHPTSPCFLRNDHRSKCAPEYLPRPSIQKDSTLSLAPQDWGNTS